ncbi:MAG: glycoside hydrolase family 127 protein [Bacteroidales bacterium]|nr:glycoside hydrolase family 127 protein [Bacteroidales bacterium]
MKNISKYLILFSTIVTGSTPLFAQGYPITPVSFTQVKVTDGFWGSRLKASREVTIPLAFSKCEETGRYDNFIKASQPSDAYKVGGYPFDDTDVYKTIEGASYSLQTYPDKKLEHYIDSVLTIVAKGQEPDGYLNTARTMNPAHPHEWVGKERWSEVEELSHEFYNLGHMLEAAVAHFQATGKRNFLDIAIRYADCVCREIGPNPGQQVKIPGHQIAEMGLCKLYLVTGDKKYLDQAKFFLDMRGKTSHRNAYNQTRKPVTEEFEAVGHAVRAAYQYSGMADVAALTGDKAYIAAIDSIWNNIVSKKLYITGGIGAKHDGEAFGKNYELPNSSAYCETCAAIGNVYLNHRLFLLHGESKYYDVLERTLYNGLISGVSMDGGTFFYPNPLSVSDKGYERQPWFGCACCPSNISRFIPSVPGYVYAVKERDLYVNLFMQNEAEINVGKDKFKLSQETNYPWNGDVRIRFLQGKGQLTLNIRIPGWVQNQVLASDLYTYADDKHLSYKILVNGEEVKSDLKNGYFQVSRMWKKNDNLEIHFDMAPRLVKANEKVEADRNRMAIECGPIVYCAEFADNQCDVNQTLISQNATFENSWSPTLLNGINVIHTTGTSLVYDKNGNLELQKQTLKFIPYYSYAHRGAGAMNVWFPYRIDLFK